jgi:hypothetical protein
MATKRSAPRVGLWIPVRVEGRDASAKPWEERSKTLDASASGVAFVVKHVIAVGDIVQITLPLPRQFRSHDLAAATYQTFAVVASTAKVAAGCRVGAAFLGKEPPKGEKPPGTGVRERRRGKRGALLLKVHLRFDQPQKGVRSETTVLEDFSAQGAKVRSRHDPKPGQTLEIDESEHAFSTRAEVRGSYVGSDGIRRLHLRFLPPAR